MAPLQTILADGLPPDEIEYCLSVLDDHEWTHTMTLGVAGDLVSYGDVWMSVTKGCSELVRVDPSAQYAIWVCKNIHSTGREGRPHAHGVVRTALKQYRLNACFYTYNKNSYRAEPVTEENDVEGWFEYILHQAVRGSLITNIIQEVFA